MTDGHFYLEKEGKCAWERKLQALLKALFLDFHATVYVSISAAHGKIFFKLSCSKVSDWPFLYRYKVQKKNCISATDPPTKGTDLIIFG